MCQIRAKLNFNKKVKGKYFHLLLKVPRIAKQAQPGQFVDIRIDDSCQPLLRRPFSIHRVSAANIEILYEALGEGTEILSQRKAGKYLDIIGPLGNGFDYRRAYGVARTALLVAGGMGVAPLLFLAEKLNEHNTQYLTCSGRQGAIRNTLVLIGAKTKGHILCEKEFKKLGYSVKIATDDGSRGIKGKVTELLKEILVSGLRSQVSGQKLATCDLRLATIYACGPRPMLKEIATISKEYKIPAQVSLEEHMACGIGACLGCVVNTIRGFRRVCKEGPVFNADEIVW